MDFGHWEKGNTKMIICESNSQSIKTTQTQKRSIYNKKGKCVLKCSIYINNITGS